MKVKKIAHTIEKHYKYHGIKFKLKNHSKTPDGKQHIFKIKFKPGIKVKKLFDRAYDIQAALGLPLLVTFKDGCKTYIAVSEHTNIENSLEKILKNPKYRRCKMAIPLALGYDIKGDMVIADMADFFHALYSGSTNSGKTVGLQNLILSIAVKQYVKQVNLLIIDTGAGDLDMFEPLPHLICPIVKNTEDAVKSMMELANEMESRSGKNNEELKLSPAIVCIVDEYNTLIDNIKDKGYKEAFITALSDILRRGRHYKIHMVLATQEPTKQDTFINHNNLNARMAFKCASVHNSISALGEKGAEKLPGKGAMLFKMPGCQNPMYIQGAYMDPENIKELITEIAAYPHDLSNRVNLPGIHLPQRLTDEVKELIYKPILPETRKELAGIILWSLNQKTVSSNKIVEQFNMGKNRADSFIDEMVNMNIATKKFANQPRKVIPQSIEDLVPDVMELLQANKISEDDIITAFQNRGGIQKR